MMSSQSVKIGIYVRPITYDLRAISQFRGISSEVLSWPREFRAIGELLARQIELLPIVSEVLARPREFRALHEFLSSALEVLTRPAQFRAIKVSSLQIMN
ncbi:hypothetical protein J4G37_49170, partial [Microvirga sp. 3-52]|nr:hypothetical protein [Microvirga sp. 3-52]